MVRENLVKDVLEDFFRDGKQWYLLGAGMTAPTPGGLGQFISNHSTLTPRHASALAAILVADGLLEFRSQSPIELRKVKR